MKKARPENLESATTDDDIANAVVIMEWVSRLLDALTRRTIKLTKSEHEILLREKEGSQKHAVPSEIQVDLSYKYGLVGASSSVVDAQLDPNSIEEASIAGENQAYQEEAGK